MSARRFSLHHFRLVAVTLLGSTVAASADALLDSALDVDAQGLTVTSNSVAKWVGSASGSHDGMDVAVSPPIGDDASTSFELALTGPDTVSFWWKVSSEPTFDTLSVSVDGIAQGVISGETEWKEEVIVLSAGAHTIRWTYAKDFESEPGPQQDRGWVDEIRVASKRLPTVDYPASVGAYLGEPIEISPAVIGKVTSFTLDGSLPSWIQFDSSSGRISGQADTAGEVSLSVTAHSANGSTSPAEIRILTSELGTGLESLASGWNWEGDQAWFTQQARSYDGIDALRSGAIGPSQSSQLNLPLTGPAVIRFRWRVDSEGAFDKLSFLIDGAVIEEISDLVDWERRAIAVPSGPHRISWRYAKDGANDEGEDAAWLDDLEILDGGDPDGDGICTLIEACLGLDWERPSIDSFQLPTEAGGRLSWQIDLGSDLLGIVPVVEISYDLRNWSSAPFTILPNDGNPNRVTVIEMNTNPSSRKFVRLRAAIFP